jgi:hypothetical protein
MRRSLVWLLVFSWTLAGPLAGPEAKPKLGPDAVPITREAGYLHSAPAPDYWKLSAFYVPQFTTSACSVASVTMAINFARGLPEDSEEPIVTQKALLEKVADAAWSARGAEGGDGVTFDEFLGVLEASLQTYKVQGYGIEVIRPRTADAAALARVRAALAANEASDHDLILIYFNQGVLTGDWDGPHISPIGAYDQATHRVLIMDVDREWYVPYWSPDTKLLDAMLKPAPVDQGPLAGQTGGLIWLKLGAASAN